MRKCLVTVISRPENVKAMSSDVRLAALQVVDQFVSHVQSGAEKPVNILDWMSKATYVSIEAYLQFY